MATKYSYDVFYSDEDEKYIAVSPEFGNQMAGVGDTAEEALKEAESALRLLIEDYQAEGDPLPSPRKAQEYSGKLSLRIPKSLHKQISRFAEEEGVSINQYIVSKLSYDTGLVYQHKKHMEELGKLKNSLFSMFYKVNPDMDNIVNDSGGEEDAGKSDKT